jgi:hypothetical protein
MALIHPQRIAWLDTLKAMALFFDLRRLKGPWRGLIPAGCLIILWAGIRATVRVDMDELLCGNLATFYLSARPALASALIPPANGIDKPTVP